MTTMLCSHKPQSILTVVLITMTLLTVACAPTEDPFVIDERAAAREATPTPSTGPSPTPLPTVSPQEATRQSVEREEAFMESLFEETIGTIKIGEWKDNKERQVINYIAGYIMVYGYDYGVELVETSDAEFRDALPKGE